MDNMPSVVPDMYQFNMPNAANTEKYFDPLTEEYKTPGRIPNITIPYKNIPGSRNK